MSIPLARSVQEKTSYLLNQKARFQANIAQIDAVFDTLSNPLLCPAPEHIEPVMDWMFDNNIVYALRRIRYEVDGDKCIVFAFEFKNTEDATLYTLTWC